MRKAPGLAVAHRGEWDIDQPIDIVVSLLHLGIEHTDDCKSHSIQSNGLADSPQVLRD